jgi:hypothetical protein
MTATIDDLPRLEPSRRPTERLPGPTDPKVSTAAKYNNDRTIWGLVMRRSDSNSRRPNDRVQPAAVAASRTSTRVAALPDRVR